MAWYLPWLCKLDNATTAGEVAELIAYFGNNPEQLQEEATVGRLPLHWAAWSQRGRHGVAVVKALLVAYPQAAQHKNSWGSLPLHLAARHQTDWEARRGSDEGDPCRSP